MYLHVCVCETEYVKSGQHGVCAEASAQTGLQQLGAPLAPERPKSLVRWSHA